MRKNFRTYRLATEFYHHVSALRLPPHLKDQLLRAASSIALNLAEGSERRTPRDQKKFFCIAFGSLRECQAVLDLSTISSEEAEAMADKLGAHLYRLVKQLGV